MMNDNKLIAEFMSGDFKVNAHYGINIDFLKDNITAKQLENDLRYDKSWDWLMPVVEKIENGGLDPHEMIDKSLRKNKQKRWRSIEDLYNVSVYLIKIHNKSNKMDNLPPHVQ